MSSPSPISTLSDPQRPASPGATLGLWPLAQRSWWFFRHMLWPVALGVAVATAVIVGALLVGDSVRGSLHFLAIDRLGRIDSMLLAPRFFDESTLDRWRQDASYPAKRWGPPLPLILFPHATLERLVTQEGAPQQVTRSGSSMVLGITDEFWKLGSLPAIPKLNDGEILINAALADELGASVGDLITVRLPAQLAVPADSPLGRRDSETVNLPRLKLRQIVPNQSLGRFDLRGNQRPPMNAFVAKTTLQKVLERDGQVNAAVMPSISHHQPDSQPPPIEATSESSSTWLDSLPLSLDDLGFQVSRVRRTFPDPQRRDRPPKPDAESQIVYDYYHLTTDQLLIPDRVVEEVKRLYPGQASSPILTYLANGIELVGEKQESLSIPYSTISAIETELLGDKNIGFSLASDPSPLQDKNAAVIHQWLAEQLNAKVGDELRIEYFLPETVDGQEIEKEFTARISAIVPLSEPVVGYERRRVAAFATTPTPFNDPALTPEVPGITDQASISDWDLPFPLTRTIREEDDDYWTNHRLTPKVFLPLEKGQSLFGSRFGKVSSIRLSTELGATADAVAQQLEPSLRKLKGELGWQIMPLMAQQIAAARGTTPFDGLFLALSFFVILAALVLVSLLFRLGIERRASHWGLLLSIGWPISRVRQLLSIEGWGLAVVGGILGVGLGVLYAVLVLFLLRSWWIGAVGAPFLQFFWTSRSLVIGWSAGFLTAWWTIYMSTRWLGKTSAVRLLQGRTDRPPLRDGQESSWHLALVIAFAIGTAIAMLAGGYLQGQAAGGAFVGAGMLALATAFTELLRRLQRRPTPAETTGTSLVELAFTSIRRNPVRTALTVGLMSVATLLILSMSLFEMAPDVKGTGGFQWMAQSSVPIAKSLNDGAYLRETLGESSSWVESADIVPLRVRDGDDAGCNNLYQATQPRVLGVSSKIAEFEKAREVKQRFAWASQDQPQQASEEETPWRLLERRGNGTQHSPIPVVIDQNTALWALHLTGGVGQTFQYRFGTRELHFQTVALLQNTTLQGSLLISEENFVKAFPELSGYRAWLIHVPDANTSEEVARLLENGWGDEGMDVEASATILQGLLAVQNTYLKAFQSLGALGLLLGMFGLAVVQLRSVMERQPELGLLRAIGFPRQRIGQLILLECLVLLLLGLGIGVVSAALALLPSYVRGTLSPQWIQPVGMLLAVAVGGILASLWAVRRAMQLRLIDSLRGG